MAIVDGRTSINAADATTNWLVLSGGFTLDNDTFIEGTGSVTFNLTSSVNGLLYDLTSTSDFTGEHIYAWVNCGIAGLLDTQANGGLRFRFTGPTTGDYFEANIAGSDNYTGGWKLFIIDVDAVAASPDGTGGTPPAKTAIQKLGFIGDTGGSMTKKQDNFWVDAMWRLPAATAGIRVEGQNTGSVDWNWADVVSWSESNGLGMATSKDGVIKLNAPTRFGANDASTHGFSDTNQIIAWEDQPVDADLYEIEIIGGSGTQLFRMGSRVGSGDDAVGISGCVITAEATGVRWKLTATDSNIDAAEMLGCSLFHADVIDISGANSELRSCTIDDASSIIQSDAGGDGIFARNRLLNANTADGVALVTADSLNLIKNNDFVFSDGHAVELTSNTGSPFTYTGNTHTNYGANDTNDAALYNNSAGAATVNVTGGVASPTRRNGTSASTTINNNVQVTLTGMKDNTEVRVYTTGTQTELAGIENATAGSADDRSFAFSLAASTVVDIVIFNVLWILPPGNRIDGFTMPTSDAELPVTQVADRVKI